MSSRRKGKPQHRKKIETVEADEDLITCADCNQEFLLSDIVLFIRHKVNRCNKDTCDPCEEDDYEDDEAMSSLISSRRTSISAPIARRGTPEPREKLSPRPSVLAPPADDDDISHLDKMDDVFESKCDQRSVGRCPLDAGGLSRTYVDAEANTVYSEPSSFVCGTCKSEYSSAWFLMQHVQEKHGLNIYIEENGSPLSPRLDALDKLVMEKQAEVKQEPDDSNRSPSVHSKTSPVQRSPSHGSPSSSSETVPLPYSLNRPSPISIFSQVPFTRPPHGADYSSRIMHREFIPDFRGFIPPGFEHHTVPRVGYPQMTSRETSALESYSQRLRQLATYGGPSDPPSRTPSALGQQSSANFGSSSGNQAQQSNDASKPTTPQKSRACEFCGKCFRFQSNLIVHRRSHTGEKPFRCHLCPHACTQASKLKRHMKTHFRSQFRSISNSVGTSNVSTPSGSRRSSTSTPDSKLSKQDDDNNETANETDEDEEELDEDVVAAREAEAEEELRKMQAGEMLTPSADDIEQLQPTDLSQGRRSEESVSSDKLQDQATDLSVGGGTLSKDQQQANILTELMNNSGLGSIEQYKVAYSQALEENSKTKTEGTEEDGEIKENGVQDRSTPEEKPAGINPSHFDASPESKKIKLEPDAGSPPDTPTSVQSNPFPLPMEASMFARERYARESYLREGFPSEAFFPPNIWFPPPGPGRDFYPPPFNRDPHLLVQSHRHNQENGMTHSSALKVNNSPKHIGSIRTPGHHHSVSTNSHSPVSGMSARRRNDTCEFCGKIFKNCSNLTVHRRSHTGEKPYKCELCAYACAQSSKLTRHMKTHGRMGKDVYHCKFCSMPFSVASTLEKHMRKCVDNKSSMSLMSPTTAASMLDSRGSRTSTPIPLGDNKSSMGLMSAGTPGSLIDGRGSASTPIPLSGNV